MGPTQLSDHDRVKDKVNELINLARAFGFIVTIDLVPQQPLAMGNYMMVANVRKARKK